MTRRWQFAAISTAAVALLGAMVFVISARDASAAPNLVSNGDFAISITGWTTGPDTGISWDSDDAGGSSSSGSIQVDFLGTAPNTANGMIGSCIDLTASGAGTYELAAAIKNPATNDFGTAVFVRVDLYAENTCSTLNNTFDTLPVINSGAWTVATEPSVAVTGSDLGAIVSLWVDAAVDAQTAYFDNVSFSNGAVDTPTPLPTETDTPAPDTATPLPADTSTPEPDTPTPAPDTETPTPEPDTPTPDPAATDTPAPAATDTPSAPAPTDTPSAPAPTDTPSAPAPTDTPGAPVPTDTPGAPAPTDTPGAAATSTPGGATSTPGGATSTPDAESTPEDEDETPEPTEETADETPVTAPTEPVGPPPASGVEDPASNSPMNDGGPGGITDLQQGAEGLPNAGAGDAATETPFALAMAVLALTMAGSLLLLAHNVRRQEDRNG